MNVVGYSTPHAMAVRYGHVQNAMYAYKAILVKIQSIKHEFGSMNKQQRDAYIMTLESQISKVLLKTEREWLQDSLDFELSVLNLGYCIKA